MVEPAPTSVASYVESSFALLARETPLHFDELRRRLGPLVVRMAIGTDDPFTVDLRGGAPWVGMAPRADVDVRLAADGISGFLEGTLSFEDALERGSASVRADAEDAARVLDALRAWLHGALRSPSFPHLAFPIHGLTR